MTHQFGFGWAGTWLACAVLFSACGSSSSNGNGGSAGGGAGKGSSSSTAGRGMGGKGSAGGTATGKAGSGSAGKGGATTGTGTPFVPKGDPLKGPDNMWTWVDFPDTHCRDNSMAGLAVNMSSTSKKVMIYLEGGGACFDTLTCGTNPANVGTMKAGGAGGIFDRSNAENPVKDWSFVYVPYCTGDVHAGTKDDGMVPGVSGTQHFVGRLNVEAFMNRLVPTFKDATQVLLTGASAGGFGASANEELVAWAFGSIPVTMIDDSGPPMSSQYLPSCLQDKWRALWGFDDSILKDCGADCPNHSDFEIDYTKHLAKKFTGMAGLIESSQDSTISGFFGYGQNNCAGSFFTPVPADQFTAGLLDYRATVQKIYPNFGTYYPPSTQHTWIGGASFYTTTVGGVRMVDWFKNIVDGVKAEHVGP